MAGPALASPTSQTDQQSSGGATEAANCVSGQLSQLEHLGASKDAGEQLMSLSAQGSWTWEKLVWDWKNGNCSWKSRQDNPSGSIPTWHLRSKNQESPTWFGSSFSNLPSQELSVADWCEQYSPAYGQGGKLNVRTGYLQLL